MKSAWVRARFQRTLEDSAGEFILDSESVPRAVASVTPGANPLREPRSVLIRQQYLEAGVPSVIPTEPIC